MVVCPRCGFGVDHLHPIPPEVITKELLGTVRDGESAVELETCNRCITELMERG